MSDFVPAEALIESFAGADYEPQAHKNAIKNPWRGAGERYSFTSQIRTASLTHEGDIDAI